MSDTTLTGTLERLVREGVITDFELPPGSKTLALHVIVTAPVITNVHCPGYDRETVERVRRHVTHEIESFRGDGDVLVSVRGIAATDEEHDLLRLVYAETHGRLEKRTALTELPAAALALARKGYITIREDGPDLWQVALTEHGQDLARGLKP